MSSSTEDSPSLRATPKFSEDFFCGQLLPDDIETIARLLAKMDPWRTLGYTPAGLARYLSRDDPALACHTVRGGAGMAAVVCIRRPWLMGPFIELLACFDPYRGRGLGREILGWVESGLERGNANLWTTVSSFNVDALGFYRRMGFGEVAELKDLIRAGHDEILLRKRRID